MHAAILCSAEALDLMIGDSLQPDNRKSLRFICDYGDQLLRLLSDFLEINKIQSGHLEIQKQLVSVPQICESVVGLLTPIAQRKDIKIIISSPQKLPHAWIDPGHLKQILFNLVHNAVKFSYPNSEVHVGFKSLSSVQQLLIEVSDRGPGIPESRREIIFNPYAHFDNPDLGEREEGGLGLGLALCRSLIELEGGTIDVFSVPGEGSLFSVRVPVQGMAISCLEEASLEGIPAESHALEGKRILLVDSDLGTRESVSVLVKALGGVADAAQGVEDALGTFKNNFYDAVLIEGKDLDGLEKLKNSDLVDSSTRYLISSNDSVQVGLGILADQVSVTEKPINRSRLTAIMRTSNSSK